MDGTRKQKPHLLRGVTLAVGLAAVWCLPAVAADPIPRGNHGAATEAYQQQVLAKLLPETDVQGYVPKGVDPVYWQKLIPEGNAMTPERVALGKKLYFDPRLSRDGTVSCATCHDTTRGFSDQQPTSEGIDGQFGRRNSPTTMNVALLHSMFWDGRSPTVEHQATQPIINPVEMGMPNDPETIVLGIKDDAEYQAMFLAAYGTGVNYQDAANAMAAFERTLYFMDSPFRRYMNGDENAISADAKEGWKLFNREGRCMTCHTMSPSNPIGSDSKFHNIGVAARNQNFAALAAEAKEVLQEDSSHEKLDQLALASDYTELGRFVVTTNVNDIGAFRTPMLLNVGVTGPYMHDGSLVTLWDVLDHYNKGGRPNLYLDGGIEPLHLSETQINQIVAFLFSLTDVRFAAENEKNFQQQKAQAAKVRPERDREVADREVLSFEKFQGGTPVKGDAK